MKKKIGFTIGKFAPFHKGHEFLIQTALNEMDEVYVIVYETNLTSIPVSIRSTWITNVFPKVKVLYAYDPPTKIGLDPESVKIQMEYLKKIINPIPVTHFYCSEKYGQFVAKSLNIIERNVDYNRDNVKISSTIIRNDLESNKKYLEAQVYNDIKRLDRRG